MPTFHLRLSTIRLNGEILAGSLGRSLLNISENSVQTLISQGIVEKSQSPHYSQILMVPKPDGTFRMCVDYRALHDCTADASWPIPNIAEMLRRIGSQKPKIFGIMDLTQGYHQDLTIAW